MTKIIAIREAGRFVEDENKPGVMVVRVIREGQGSSGVYTRELLESATDVFANTKSYINHPVDGDPTKRNFMEIVGLVGETWFSDHEGFGALYAEFTPVSAYADRLQELKDVIGLSIFAQGKAREADNGDIIVESFDDNDPYRSVDVVVEPGAGGSMSPTLQENRRALHGLVTENKEVENDMEKELQDLTATVAGLATQVESLIKANTPDPAEEQEKIDIASAVEAYAAAAEAIDAADLTEGQRKDLKARALQGEDVTEAIEAAKALKAEITESIKPAPGTPGVQAVIIEESANDAGLRLPKKWK